MPVSISDSININVIVKKKAKTSLIHKTLEIYFKYNTSYAI